MASSKVLCFGAVTLAFLAVAVAFPGPHPGPAAPGPVAPARIQEAAKGEKTDLKAESSYGFGYGGFGGYGYGGYGGYGGYPYSYGYGSPYGYSYGYPYGYGWGTGYGYPYYG